MHIIILLVTKCVRILYIIFSLIIRSLFSFHREKILIQQGSKYNNSIIISQYGSKRLMRFQSLTNGAQAQIDLNRIDYPYVDYIQLMIISLIYYPFLLNEKQILIIGLGGGTLPRAIRKLYPMSFITIIEIDPIVKQMAEKYFDFKEDLRMKIFLCDGRTFINNLSNKNVYDIILFDAYDSTSGLPYHMKTQQFFFELKNSLSLNGGLLIVNLVCIYKSYLNVRQTISSVFGETNLITFRSNDFVNIVAIASSSIQHFPTINYKSNIINLIKQQLEINVDSLLKRRQQQLSNENLSSNIYTDQMQIRENEQEMSLTQFVNIV
jgi:spermidine synthase